MKTMDLSDHLVLISGGSTAVPGVDLTQRPALLPLEEAMVLQALSGSNAWANVEQVVLDLDRGAPSGSVVQAAVEDLLRRHAFLGTVVQMGPLGKPAFVPSPGIQPQFTEAASPGKTGWTDRALADWLAQDRNRGFDLIRDIGWRVALFRRAANQCRLVLTIHHAKADQTTMARLAEDLLTAIFSNDSGTDPGTDTNTDSGRAVAVAQATDSWHSAHARLWSAYDPAKAEDFFTRHLCGDDAIIHPITTAAVPARPISRMEQLTADLSASETARLSQNLARLADPASPTGSGFRLLHGLQLALGLALARHCGTSAAQFGLTFSGRTVADPDAQIRAAGSLIATLPQRLNLGTGRDIAGSLADLAQSTRDLRAFHCTEYDDIARWSGPENRQSSLFDTALVYSPQTLAQMLKPVLDGLGGGTATLLEEGRLPVTLAVYGQDSLSLTLEYDPDRLDPARATPLLAHVQRLLVSLGDCHGSGSLGDLTMLDSVEMSELIRLANPDLTPPDAGAAHLDPITRFEQRCVQDPHATAILQTDGQKLDFARLDVRANGMAQELLALGVKPGQIVALNLRRGLDQVIAFLAVQKLGAAALPLDPETPEFDRKLRATECNVAAVIGHEGLAGLTVPLLAPRGALALHPPKRPADQGDRLAYVLHTSGSSGRPKAVMGSTGALSAHASAIIRTYGLRATDRVLQFTSPSFDVALEEMIPTLLVGATLVMRPDETSESIPAFLEYLNHSGATVANLPAGFWHLLVAEMVDRGLRMPQSLRLVITGSERVDNRAWADWARLAPAVECMNCYGPTETTIGASHYRIGAGKPLDPNDEVPIGRPLDHARLHVISFDGSPAPMGAEGELWISGPCVTLGYLDRPTETAASFVKAPLMADQTSNARAYRTGDRARWKADGMLMFLGRRDRQVKIRGQRIDLEDLERQLQQFPEIREVHVAILGKGPTARLMAWVAGPDLIDDQPAVQALRRIAAERFGRAALPTLIAVPELARKPNGKVDVAALPLPMRDHQPTPDDLDPAAGPAPDAALVSAIGKAMGDVLGLEMVAPGADIRDLGANSLTILRMASVLESRFGRPVRSVDLFHYSTPTGFARWLGSADQTGAVGAIKIQPVGSAVPFVGVHLLGDREQLYRPLSAALGADFPVWGVTIGAPKSLDEIDIPRVAELYRRDIEKTFPTGPIALGGSSLAAYFAYELAQLLLASGREVRLVAVFDIEGPAGRPKRRGWNKVKAHLRQLLHHGPAHLTRSLRLRANGRLIHAVMVAAENDDQITGESLVHANIRAAKAYHPLPLACPVVVYRAADSFWDSQAALNDALGWRGVAAAGVDLVDVPGDHLGMLKAGNVEVMAADLANRLKR